jgi:hypothetical protein
VQLEIVNDYSKTVKKVLQNEHLSCADSATISSHAALIKSINNITVIINKIIIVIKKETVYHEHGSVQDYWRLKHPPRTHAKWKERKERSRRERWERRVNCNALFFLIAEWGAERETLQQYEKNKQLRACRQHCNTVDLAFSKMWC